MYCMRHGWEEEREKSLSLGFSPGQASYDDQRESVDKQAIFRNTSKYGSFLNKKKKIRRPGEGLFSWQTDRTGKEECISGKRDEILETINGITQHKHVTLPKGDFANIPEETETDFSRIGLLSSSRAF
ncbi:hypothetical protein WUBG_10690 [Wuchereria bancrofti]|uniref:Uncharacterized protein n=1 Tax=Wuchereria bancrofti TaxID=6293 RepID=J9E7U8_WUCBA|nr:hypothetical protein WUBG_10690 [Wuchereria bancrofti]